MKILLYPSLLKLVGGGGILESSDSFLVKVWVSNNSQFLNHLNEACHTIAMMCRCARHFFHETSIYNSVGRAHQLFRRFWGQTFSVAIIGFPAAICQYVFLFTPFRLCTCGNPTTPSTERDDHLTYCKDDCRSV